MSGGGFALGSRVRHNFKGFGRESIAVSVVVTMFIRSSCDLWLGSCMFETVNDETETEICRLLYQAGSLKQVCQASRVSTSHDDNL